MADAKVRVLVIEDHGIVREGLKLILQGMPDFEVVGEAADGASGVRLFQRLLDDSGVDLVMTDLGLPDIGGVEVTRQIKALRPETRVVVLTMHAGDEYVRGVIDAGADGYLLKQSSPQQLAEGLRTAARGELALSPVIGRWLMTQLRQGSDRERRASLLTERERQVLNHLAGGATSKEIAQRLGLSAKTVENHRARILEKLGVTNTAAAIGLAYEQGLIVTAARP